MSPPFRQAVVRICCYLALGLLVGNELDNFALGTLFALAAYVISVLFNFRRFQRWLDDGMRRDKPLLNSVWGSVADQVYRVIQQYRNERENLQQELDFFKDSFQALDSALVVISSDGLIDWTNRAAKDLLGVDASRDRGQKLVSLFRTPAFNKFLRKADFAEPLIVESPRRPDMTLEVQVMPFRSNYLLIFVRDISEVIRLEQVRQDFITNVSHELRTPLTVVSGYLGTLRDNAGDLPQAWLRVFDQMLAQTQRMDNMVTDLIWLSRLESVPETEHNDRVPLLGLLNSVIADASVAAPEKALSLDCGDGIDDGTALNGSYDELRSAFSNLVNNAVKYTGEGGEVVVRCSLAGDSLTVMVADNGEGIDPVHIPRLTERFYRTDSSRTSSTGGTGLGLAIVKHVLNRHDAALKIRSALGKGSTFSCVFPLSRLCEQPPAES